MSPPPCRRTLVIHAGGVGDFVSALPALRSLGQEGPLELLGRPERMELAVAAGVAQAAHDMEAADLHTLYSTASARWNEFLLPFQRVISWIRLPAGAVAHLEAGGLREVHVLPGLPPVDWAAPAWHYFLQSINAPLPWKPPHLSLPQLPAGADVLLHPGSGSPTKNWPSHNFESVAHALEGRGLRVAWIFGPAEAERGLHLQGRQLPPESLVSLGGRLQTVRLYIGNDSGISHLAAAVGCPTIAIFGPTDAHIWAPSGAHVIRRVEGWPAPGEVIEAALNILSPNLSP
jgi:heptosyltransferase-3